MFRKLNWSNYYYWRWWLKCIKFKTEVFLVIMRIFRFYLMRTNLESWWKPLISKSKILYILKNNLTRGVWQPSLLCLRNDLRTQVEKILEPLPNPYTIATKLTGLRPVFWHAADEGMAIMIKKKTSYAGWENPWVEKTLESLPHPYIVAPNSHDTGLTLDLYFGVGADKEIFFISAQRNVSCGTQPESQDATRDC